MYPLSITLLFIPKMLRFPCFFDENEGVKAIPSPIVPKTCQFLQIATDTVAVHRKPFAKHFGIVFFRSKNEKIIGLGLLKIIFEIINRDSSDFYRFGLPNQRFFFEVGLDNSRYFTAEKTMLLTVPLESATTSEEMAPSRFKVFRYRSK